MQRYYDPAIARWGQVDALAAEYAAWSPYNYVTCTPVNAIDPDGRSGVPIIVKENKTITVHSKFVFYGGAATTELSNAIANEIAAQYNGVNGKVNVYGVEFDKNGKGQIGTATNKIYDANGYEKK